MVSGFLFCFVLFEGEGEGLGSCVIDMSLIDLIELL